MAKELSELKEELLNRVQALKAAEELKRTDTATHNVTIKDIKEDIYDILDQIEQLKTA